MDTTTKTAPDALKSVSKKAVHKAAEATGEFIGNKIADKIIKPKAAYNENSIDTEKINIPPKTREEILNELRQVL